MADSGNTYNNLKPIYKNKYADKIKKLSEKNEPKKYFSYLKNFIKKNK